MPPRDEVAEAVRALRKKLNVNQQKFSDMLGVTMRTVVHYENDRPPTDPNILRQLHYLAIDANDQELAAFFGERYWSGGETELKTIIQYIWNEAQLGMHQARNATVFNPEPIFKRIERLCLAAFPQLKELEGRHSSVDDAEKYRELLHTSLFGRQRIFGEPYPDNLKKEP